MPREKLIESRAKLESSNKESFEREWEANVSETKALMNRPSRELSREEEQAVEFYRQNPYEVIFPKEQFVESKLAELDKGREIQVLDKYRDEGLLAGKYKKLFVEYSRVIYPKKWRGLLDLVPLFRQVFTNRKYPYQSLFQTRIFSELVDARRYLVEEATSITRDAKAFSMFRPEEVQYQTVTLPASDRSFIWGDFREVLLLAHLKELHDLSDTRRTGIVGLTLDAIKSRWHIRHVHDDESEVRTVELEPISVKLADEILEGAIAGESRSIARCRYALSRMIGCNDELVVSSFLELTVRLILWAETNHHSKDWLVSYALWFLDTAAGSTAADPMSADVPTLQLRSLEAEPFLFQFEPWLPGEDSREFYLHQLGKAFDAATHQYFQDNGRRLNLDATERDSVKGITNRLNANHRWIKWLIARNEGGTFEMIASAAGKKSDATVKNAIKVLKSLDLPVRQDDGNTKAGASISLRRIDTILSTVLPSK